MGLGDKISRITQRFAQSDGNSRTVAVNMAANGAFKGLSMVLGYVYVPIAMHYLGVEKYGAWATILSILSWITYFDIGVGNGLRNRLTESLTQHDDERSKKLVSSAYAIITLITVAVSAIALVIATQMDWERVLGLVASGEDLGLVVSVSAAFVALNFVLSICKNVLYALQRAASVSAMELFTQLFNLVGVLVASRFTQGNLFAMAFIYGLSMTLVSLGTSVIVYARNPVVRPSLHAVDTRLGMDLTSLGLQFFVIQICALVLFTTDNLVISSLYGATDVTPYTTVNKLFSVIANVFTALLAPIWSSVTKAKAEDNFPWMAQLIRRLNVLMLPFFGAALVLMLVFRPLSAWWLGMELDYGSGLIALGALYCVLTIWCNTYSYVANGLELMRVSVVVAVTQAVVNIPLSVYFARVWDMKSAGVLLGTVLAMAISAVAIPIAVRKRVKSGLDA